MLIVDIQNDRDIDILIEGCYIEENNEDIPFFMADGKITVIPSLEKNLPHKVLVGLGKQSELTANKLRNLSARVARATAELEGDNISVSLPLTKKMGRDEFFSVITEGILLTDYSLDKYKSGAKKPRERFFTLANASYEDKKAIEEATVVSNAINTIRPLVNEPCNELYPESLLRRIEKIGEEFGFEVSAIDYDGLLEKGLNGIVSVGKGSEHKPYLIVMRYSGDESGEKIGLIGKGITCDTGGYCLKGRESLPYIKGDMAGGANIVGAMCAISKNRLRANVVGIIPTAENRISSSAYMSGDVIKMYSGKTVEVLDTDCEGRMVLADALTYAVKDEKVDKLIDMATLTGLAGSTFGSLYTPLFGSDEGFTESFLENAVFTDEDYWRMPLDDRYKSYLNSSIADLANKAGAGTITAAMFLKEFTDNKPWIHLDIAATATQYPIVNEYAENAPTGIGIRTIYRMLGGYSR